MIFATEVSCLPFPLGVRENWDAEFFVAYWRSEEIAGEDLLFLSFVGIDAEDCYLSVAEPLYHPISEEYVGCVPEGLWDVFTTILADG